MGGDDLGRLFSATDEVKRWQAERENASARLELARVKESSAFFTSQYESARLELARVKESSAFLTSQHEPVHSLGIDRDVLRILLSFVRHNDKSRLTRELAALTPESNI